MRATRVAPGDSYPKWSAIVQDASAPASVLPERGLNLVSDYPVSQGATLIVPFMLGWKRQK